MKELHPFWHYLPQERRTRIDELRFKVRRLFSLLQQRQAKVVIITSIYVLIWSLPLMLGQFLVSLFALLPLLLVPPVGLLIYWLVWKEFNG